MRPRSVRGAHPLCISRSTSGMMDVVPTTPADPPDPEVEFESGSPSATVTPLPQRVPGSGAPPRPGRIPLEVPEALGTEEVMLIGGPRCGHLAHVPPGTPIVAVLPSPLAAPGAVVLTPGDPGMGLPYAIYRRAAKPAASAGLSSAMPRFVEQRAYVVGGIA